jgi:hypothetical protein
MEERKKTSCMSELRIDATDAIDVDRALLGVLRDGVLVETASVPSRRSAVTGLGLS